MKTLNKYIQESLLDNEDELIEKSDITLVEEFIKKNYSGKYKINNRPINGKYQVSGNTVTVINKNIINLTNGMFEWTTVKGYFKCYNCVSLKSLEGAPMKCNGFDCDNCASLKSLKGSPKECEYFSCNGCTALESLKGAPKTCDNFYCHNCISLKSLEGAPVECCEFSCDDCTSLESLKGAPEKITGVFSCDFCTSLKSFKDAPKECKYFSCIHCAGKFTEDDVKAVCNADVIMI